MQPVDFVDPCYHKSTFMQTYEHVLYPTTSPSLWVNTNSMQLAPPEYVKQPGRPKKLRRRGPLESSIKSKGKVKASKRGKQKCSVCGVYGHNKKKCPENGASTQLHNSGKGKGKKRSINGDEAGPSTKKRRPSRKAKKQEYLETLDKLMRTTQDDRAVQDGDN